MYSVFVLSRAFGVSVIQWSGLCLATRPYGKNLVTLAYIANSPKILIAYNVSLCYT